MKYFNRQIAKLNKKVVIGASAVGAGASNAFASGVTYTEGTGFAGSIDMTAFNSAVPLVVTVIGVVIAVTLGIRALSKAKSA